MLFTSQFSRLLQPHIWRGWEEGNINTLMWHLVVATRSLIYEARFKDRRTLNDDLSSDRNAINASDSMSGINAPKRFGKTIAKSYFRYSAEGHTLEVMQSINNPPLNRTRQLYICCVDYLFTIACLSAQQSPNISQSPFEEETNPEFILCVVFVSSRYINIT